MKKIFKSFVVLLLGLSVFGCVDLQDIEKRVDVLESKVQALQTVINTLNDNVEVLHALSDDAVIINKVTESDGVYTLTLADGRTLTLTQGSIGEGVTPVVSIDADGFWQVNYGDGPVSIVVNGEKVKAEGVDAPACAPVFGVDKEGQYWTISVDGGVTFAPVRGEDGNPVPLNQKGGSSDAFFEEVYCLEGFFVVKMKDSGEILRIPIVDSFKFVIVGAEGVQTFVEGETRTYSIDKFGVANTIMTYPSGWRVVLNDETLIVTAPVITKGLTVDTASEVSILVVSTQSLALVVKMNVEVYEHGADLWDRYQQGKNLSIGGKIINNITYPDGKLLAAPMSDKIGSGVYFLDYEEEGQTQMIRQLSSKTVLIGRYSDKRYSVGADKYINLAGTADEDVFVLANVDYSIGTATDRNALFVQVGEPNFESIIFDNVALTLNAKKAGVATSTLFGFPNNANNPNRTMTGEIVISNSDINIASSVTDRKVCLMEHTLATGVPSVKIYGNHIYSDSAFDKFQYVISTDEFTSIRTDDNILDNVTLTEPSVL